MADKNSGWACTQSASIVAETNTTVTIRVICYWQNQGWTYNMNYVSAWSYCDGGSVCVKDNSSINTTGNNQAAYEMGRHDFVVAKGTSGRNVACCTKITSNSTYASGTKWSGDVNVWVPAKPSYSVWYNANGGTGAPGTQTKWYDTNITLSSSRPSRTGYSFVNWNTNSNGTGTSYNPGGTYSGNSNITLYAIWKANTYTVTYNANGGTGAPGNQTKTYGVNLTLSSTKPTRENYNFLGWSTSASGGVVYNSGSTYSNNSAVTLYAVWELAYVKPRINNFAVQRCTSDGTFDEAGTYAKVNFDWSTDRTVTSVQIEWKIQNGDTWVISTVNASGTNGSVSEIVGNDELDVETTYMFKSSVSDSGGTTPSSQITLGTIKFPIDVKDKGKGVAIGKVSEKDDLFDVEWDAEFKKDVKAARINSYNFGVVGGASWYYIGDFVFDYQGQYAVIDCYLGDGQNGGHTQNTHMKIILKQGAPNSTYPIGVTTNFTQNFAPVSHVKVKIAHSATMECKLYIYLGFDWNDLTCIINGSYKTFTPSITTLTDTPITDKESAYYYNGGYTLYDNTSGTSGTVTLSQSIGSFWYTEIHYCDNNNRDHGSIRIYNSNNKTISLSIIEPSSGNSTYIRRTRITTSGTSVTPDITNAGYISIGENKTWNYSYGTNYIKITKIIGYR